MKKSLKMDINFILSNKEYFKNIDVLKIIRINIKMFRNKMKLTQKDLATKSNISLSHIQKIENLKLNHNLSIVVLNNIAKALEVDMNELCVEYADINYDKL